jgi:Xaa-Pro aminopeptidase
MVPLDKTLIHKNLLTKEEIDWVNTYHQTVFKNLKKYLSKQELNWLKEATSPL